MTAARRRVYIALFVVYLATMGWFAYGLGAGIVARRDLAACRAELEAVRDSLATERADLIACYRASRFSNSFMPDTIFVDTAFFRRLP